MSCRIVCWRRLRRRQRHDQWWQRKELRAGQGARTVHAARTGVFIERGHWRRRGLVREAGSRGRRGPAAA